MRALVLCKRVQFGSSQTCFGRSDRSKIIGEARAQGGQLSPHRICMPLEKRKLKFDANDFQRTIFFAKVDDVASHVRRSNTFAKIASVVTYVRMFRNHPTRLISASTSSKTASSSNDSPRSSCSIPTAIFARSSSLPFSNRMPSINASSSTGNSTPRTRHLGCNVFWPSWNQSFCHVFHFGCE